jgi:hypothetical protein
MNEHVHRFIVPKVSRTTFDMLSGIDWNLVKSQLIGWDPGQAGQMILKKESKRKSTQQLGYYFGVILPHALQAFKDNGDFSLSVEFKGRRLEMELTLDSVDKFLKLAYAKVTGKYVNKSEMDMAECSMYEDWCIKWLNQWLDYTVPPANRS